MEENIAEEQAMEIEALQATYMDDITILNTSPHQFEIKLEPNPGGADNNVIISLNITFPPRYPQEVPQIVITPIKGLKDSDCEGLQKILHAEAEQNLGMMMILILAQTAKDWVASKNDVVMAKAKEIEQARLAKEIDDQEGVRKALSELRERKIAAGTPVTPATFAEWKAKFDAEMAALHAKPKDEKLTGRQLFELDASLAASDTVEVEESESKASG
jgi:hypothetical protein